MTSCLWTAKTRGQGLKTGSRGGEVGNLTQRCEGGVGGGKDGWEVGSRPLIIPPPCRCVYVSLTVPRTKKKSWSFTSSEEVMFAWPTDMVCLWLCLLAGQLTNLAGGKSLGRGTTDYISDSNIPRRQKSTDLLLFPSKGRTLQVFSNLDIVLWKSKKQKEKE